ncbi:hypothetical protein [Aeromicrobium sp. A1-2]|uniref:hypothetical protein n=1 Tax=Aeromicrobium sp. A1-2 TaxID=2107713 RepID=UPI0013C2E1B9|nr:hypothetical protein [Aeromicrobium sp. A1-2]
MPASSSASIRVRDSRGLADREHASSTALRACTMPRVLWCESPTLGGTDPRPHAEL